MEDLLEPTDYRHLVPTLPTFVVGDHFGLKEPLDDMRMYGVGEHFTEHLLSLVEPPVQAVTVREHMTRAESRDHHFGDTPGLLEALGGEERAPITFAQLWECLLFTDRRRFHVAYVRTPLGVFGVGASWVQLPKSIRRGLYVESGPLNRPYSWAKGALVLSQ